MALVYKLFHDQLLIKLPRSEKSAKDQTVIVTGSNTGIGLESARHFVRLGAAKVILAVRTVEKGEAAKKDLENTEKRQGVVEVWPLDLSSYESVKQFAARVQGLQRLDVMLENAGVSTTKFSMAEDNESTITTNVVSTFLLALLVLPKLRETATNFNIVPHLTIVSSDVHFFTQFPEKSNPDIFQALSQKKGARMTDRYKILYLQIASKVLTFDRYNVSKLLEVFYTRELAARTKQSGKPDVIINFANPGLCYSGLTKDLPFPLYQIVKVLKFLIARTAEEGSRVFVYATQSEAGTHGEFVTNARVEPPAPLVTSKVGVETQKRVWDQLSSKLEKIQPGIMSNV